MKILSIIGGWFVLVGLVIISFLTKTFSLWIPIIIYILAAGSRVYQKVGDYRDWTSMRWQIENKKINQTAEDFANKGLAYSGMHGAVKESLRHEFKVERNQAYRKLIVDVVDSLFLK